MYIQRLFISHRIAASPSEGCKANLTRNPLQHLVDKVPVDKLTYSSYLIHVVAYHGISHKSNPARNY